MGFRVLDFSIELIRGLRSPVVVLRRRSDRLANQMEAAASSIALNIAEGNRREGRDRLHHFRIAAGSANEVRSGLRVAEAWGYLQEKDIRKSLALLDTVLAMLWSLSGGRRRTTTRT